MTDWASGYVADIDYTFGYYAELNPVRANFALLQSGLQKPKIRTACELGFGQGMSTNFHAAATGVEWYGTDFNPSQAGFARELAEVSGADAKLYDESFEEFCTRTDLPGFDYIGLHGIWSWISDFNRQLIVDFVKRKLNVGGILYVSYNTLPGWASFAPMRHLMTEHAEVIGSEGRGIVSRIDDALNFADKLMQTNPHYARANPVVGERIKNLQTQNRHYLAHEYFNKDWLPMHFSTMAQLLEPAKVQYAGSAAFLERLDMLNLNPDQQKFLNEIPDMMFKESVRDFMVNQQFRKDFWIKGARRMTVLEQTNALREQAVLLIIPRSEISLKIKGLVGEANLSAEVYNPILDYLADHKIKTIGQLETEMQKVNIHFNSIIQALVLLIGAGSVAVCSTEKPSAKIKQQLEKLNNFLIEKSRSSNDISYLASAVTGGGYQVDRIYQMFIMAYKSGIRQSAELAGVAWQVVGGQGHRLIKDGKTRETEKENIGELKARAEQFTKTTLPVLKALQIV